MIACLLLMSIIASADAQQLQKVSTDNAGFTTLPINQDGALLDPTVPAHGPGTTAAVPEPSTIAIASADARQLQKVSTDNAGFTILPINQDGALLDPTVPVHGPDITAAVPEPSTIAMLFLGSGCAGALCAFRRRRS